MEAHADVKEVNLLHLQTLCGCLVSSAIQQVAEYYTGIY